jgi:hypothetical protein
MSNWTDQCEGCGNYFPSLKSHTWRDYLDGIGQITASLCGECVEAVDLQIGLPINSLRFSLVECDGCGLEVGNLDWREHPCLDTGKKMEGAYCGECCEMIDTKQDWRMAR